MTTLVAAEAASSPAAGQLTVRAATAADDVFVDELQAIAFGPGRFARTAFRVREQFPIDPSLSLIAEVDVPEADTAADDADAKAVAEAKAAAEKAAAEPESEKPEPAKPAGRAAAK